MWLADQQSSVKVAAVKIQPSMGTHTAQRLAAANLKTQIRETGPQCLAPPTPGHVSAVPTPTWLLPLHSLQLVGLCYKPVCGGLCAQPGDHLMAGTLDWSKGDRADH